MLFEEQQQLAPTLGNDTTVELQVPAQVTVETAVDPRPSSIFSISSGSTTYGPAERTYQIISSSDPTLIVRSCLLPVDLLKLRNLHLFS